MAVAPLADAIRVHSQQPRGLAVAARVSFRAVEQSRDVHVDCGVGRGAGAIGVRFALSIAHPTLTNDT